MAPRNINTDDTPVDPFRNCTRSFGGKLLCPHFCLCFLLYQGGDFSENQMWCVNMGGYMAFGSIVGSDHCAPNMID